ncbi:MAG: polyphosphate polymerase domain-containing protein [Clostridiales bacterium]|nr:polyphosphate polymerase domain-containing protein [Clostridiales bacterium]
MVRSQPTFPTRHELKFYINNGDMAALGARLEKVLYRDSHAGKNGEYFIRSVYFDDYVNSAYYEKLEGGEARDKYRIRVYGMNEKQIYLERKRKMGDSISKSSVHITRRLAEQIMDGNPNRLELLNEPLLKDLFVLMRTRLLRPVVRVDYWREAFIYPVENTRVTFDKRLTTGPFPAGLFDTSPGIMALDDERQILEVKYDHVLPAIVSNLLAGVPAERSAISKYIHCRRFDLMK